MCARHLGLVSIRRNLVHLAGKVKTHYPRRQISALLGRPMIIDRADCNVGLPKLSLEGTQHSPLTHMKLQSELIRKLFSRFGLTKNVTKPSDVQEYQCIIEAWIADFPPPFDVHHPDKSLDKSCPWVVLHRHYIRTMAFSMLMDPIRAYLARPFTIDASDAETKIRADGINYCLELMVSLHGFFDHVYPRDAKFHFVLFCIFDTSTVLCTAILHDNHHTLPRRDEVYQAIDEAYAMLQRLSTVTKSAKASCGILSRILLRLPRVSLLPGAAEVNSAKRPRFTEFVTPTQPTPIYSDPGITSLQLISPPDSISPGHNMMLPTVTPSTSSSHTTQFTPATSESLLMNDPTPASFVDWQSQVPVGELVYPQENFANISEEDLTQLALWNYESLDFNFMPPEATF